MWRFNLITPFIVFSAIHALAVTFNIFLIVVVFKYGDKKTIPTVYIYNMAVSNSINTIMSFTTFNMPMLWTDDYYIEFRDTYMPSLTVITSLTYRYELFLPFLMIVQRVYCVYNPFNNLFTDFYLWIYCAILVGILAFFIVIPQFTNCYFYIDQRKFAFISACAPDKHILHRIVFDFTASAPYISMIISIVIIIHLSLKRGKMFHTAPRGSVSSLVEQKSVAAKRRRSYDKSMVLQLVATTIFLTIYDVSARIVGKIPVDQNHEEGALPTVYIYNMIASNMINICLTFFGFLMPLLWTDEFYNEFRDAASPILTLFTAFSYRHPLFLTFLMIIQRVGCVVSPTTTKFSDRHLWAYCAILALIICILLVVPFFSDCYLYMDQRRLAFVTGCEPNKHLFTAVLFFSTSIAPYISMVLSLLILCYLSMKRSKMSQLDRRSSSLTNTKIIKSRRRQSYEKSMMLQLISTTIFLTLYDISARVLKIIPPSILNRTPTSLFYIFYVRQAFGVLINVTVYGIGTKRTRTLIIETMAAVANGRKIEKMSGMTTQTRIFVKN
ncbi:unnamed protein product [Caenorhabditis bovis]|uniref:G-protein coupled receptors family 1 profile domain-containing protein n=1 Tax=Caenorhabditis bovis TaxID=2654633 RepID=A0A8S1E4E0_9PELO|nr:unnamed protein product [Caenorhabditis bovis]